MSPKTSFTFTRTVIYEFELSNQTLIAKDRDDQVIDVEQMDNYKILATQNSTKKASNIASLINHELLIGLTGKWLPVMKMVNHEPKRT